MAKNYYEILGINKDASPDEIKQAFRRLAHKYHPDKAQGNEEKFKEINEAYQVLSDPKKKQQYDQFGTTFEQAQGQGGFAGFDGFRDFSGFANGFDFSDLGEMFGFGDIFGGQRAKASRKARGRDIETEIIIGFEEAVFGREKEIELLSQVECEQCKGQGGEPGAKVETCQTCKGSGRVIMQQRTILGTVQSARVCPDCQGEGKSFSKKCTKCQGQGVVEGKRKLKVKIPAGVNSGEVIRLRGQGEAGLKGGGQGDLYLIIRVEPHQDFQRDGANILSEREINISQAALGDKIEVKTVEGPVKLKIPSGTQSGTVFSLKGKGVARLKRSGRGDHLVKVLVNIPQSLSRKQKKLLEELGESLG